MSSDNGGPVWAQAIADGRDYITPEDVTAAIESGAAKVDIWKDVLDAVERGGVEDASCTCFVALKAT